MKISMFVKPVMLAVCAAHCCMADDVRLQLASLTVEVADGAADAKVELLKHIELMCGRKPDGSGEQKIMVGIPPPGSVPQKDCTSYGQLVGNTVYLWGDDSVPPGGKKRSGKRPGTLIAVYGFLEKALGVRWVRPGDDGIILKKAESIVLPSGWKFSYRPLLEMCRIRAPDLKFDSDGGLTLNKYIPSAMRQTKEEAEKYLADYRRWLLRLRLWDRNPPVFGHAFKRWNSRFHLTHPEYLALNEKGERGWQGDPSAVYDHVMMLCVSNDAVVDQIIADWVADGKPFYLNICPNDSNRYCRCDKCKALDHPLSPDEPFTAHKTDRYVNFWNRVAAKAVALRPDVKVCTYAYVDYRTPPRSEKIAYPENILLGMVPSILDDNESMIADWRKAGMRHFTLRPNYLCYAGILPRGHERLYFDNLKMNLREGVIGFDYDNFVRSDTTAFEVYAIARAMAEPGLSFETVEAEYLSQYGVASEAMGRYFAGVRMRGERMVNAILGKDVAERHLLDDSQIKDIFIRANTPDDIKADMEILKVAVKTEGLSDVEKARIERRLLMCEHMLRTREFLVARDTMPPKEFAKVALALIEYRISIFKRLPDAWGRIFYQWPSERRWWRAPGAREAIKKHYPEIALRN